MIDEHDFYLGRYLSGAGANESAEEVTDAVDADAHDDQASLTSDMDIEAIAVEVGDVETASTTDGQAIA